MKLDAIKKLEVRWGTLTVAWQSVGKLVQSASALSFAVRSPSYNDEELEGLRVRAQDLVSCVRQVAARPFSPELREWS